MDFKGTKEYIDNANTICVIAHIRPDGDAIGSLGAMYNFLNDLGKEVYMVIPNMDSKFEFMPSMDKVYKEVPLDVYDLLICLDTSSEDRINMSLDDVRKANKTIVIDHHRNNSVAADLKLIDVEAPANCEIIYDLIKYMGGSITYNIANYIYLGLMTDSGSFNYERTTSKTYRIAAEMVDCGAEFAKICKIINDTHSETKMKLIANIISNMESYFDGKVRISIITKETAEKLNATEGDLNNLVNYLRCIENTIVAFAMVPTVNGHYKISMRAEGPVDASELCKLFGGGGHKRAAGFETNDVDKTKKELLETLERLL